MSSSEVDEPANPWGVAPPSPVTESKFFNAARRIVTLLVEGRLDLRFWRIHVSPDCHVRSEGGRGNVLTALDKAKSAPDSMLLGALDADLDRLEGTLAPRPDVVWTDAHDLEGVLFASPALDKLVRQLVDPGKLAECEGQWCEPLRKRVYRHAIEMGRLRWLVARKRRENEDLGLVFKKTPKGNLELFRKYEDCVDKHGSPSLEHSIQAILNYSNTHADKAELTKACRELDARDPLQLCNGHDLIGFLRICPPIAGEKLPPDELADRLALAYERRWLAQTSMARDIATWEHAHPGYRVLSEIPTTPASSGEPAPPESDAT